jgi:hypothetical protein
MEAKPKKCVWYLKPAGKLLEANPEKIEAIMRMEPP